ncbi:MAG: hypothetical protein QME72_02580 [Rhodococcus sp. (in: high G+C Gram-positive bacteria)]|nr:hypothetical protein [Rhodococcus sp. (in: high G+C Gram-positive bacteria)]MDI6626585.1 hypothetical protein [Rhodococcus sp. (in: high G+C Gram-positive bacteria)]
MAHERLLVCKGNVQPVVRLGPRAQSREHPTNTLLTLRPVRGNDQRGTWYRRSRAAGLLRQGGPRDIVNVIAEICSQQP